MATTESYPSFSNDWVPPSAQLPSTEAIITEYANAEPEDAQPLPKPQPETTANGLTALTRSWPLSTPPKRKRKQPPTPNLHPSPGSALTASGRKNVESWIATIGSTPETKTPEQVEEKTPESKKRRLTPPSPLMPKIRKISNIKAPLYSPKHPRREVILQANGIALPTKDIFDPWNACTTGHQRAENRMGHSTDWRASRERKLKEQFSDATGRGGKRLYDTVGAGSEQFGKDGRKVNGGWHKGAPGLRGSDQKSIVDCFKAGGTKKNAFPPPFEKTVEAKSSTMETKVDHMQGISEVKSEELANDYDVESSLSAPTSNILRGAVIYINGSTYPLIGDHQLRKMIALHGGNTSLALGRKTVTHVILTHKDPPHKPAQPPLASLFYQTGTFPPASTTTQTDATMQSSFLAAGGGLAAGKIRKEVQQRKAPAIKYVTAHWVLESIKAGKRLPESRFADWRFVEKGQKDVRAFFGVGKGDEDVEKKN
ncbi:hypothetical protein BT63DRAFT_429383 [Microthyrium microscopicum]|uniref:BRCT domain-containing protein n=1 Tax=Microthyrium microscopicum TaxID=703497 RepID=A0A6A6TZ76_9PEZI|nr:hypothetical protein BT63DRAFT_429383 [Microthyrium microscopicum]